MNSSEAGVYTYKDDEGRTIKVDCSDTESCSLAEVKEAAKHGVGFSAFKAFALNAAGGDWSDYAVDFSWIISLVAGCFLVWVILSFCFDLATRVVKLAFMQIIAPIAITARIIPDNDVFKNWWKTTLQTYTSVFIRIFIMHLGVYLIRIVHEMEFFQNNCDGCSWGVTLLGNAFIIMGIVAFMKAAASLIDKIFNLGGDIKLGLSDMKDRLKGGGAFAAGAAVGSGFTTGVRGITSAGKNGYEAYKNARGHGKKWYQAAGSAIGAGAKEVGKSAYTLPGSVVRGGKAGMSANSWADTWKAAQTGASQTTLKREAREAYYASNALRDKDGKIIPIVGGLGVAGGHIKDAVKTVGKWAGIDNEELIKQQNQSIMALVNALDAVKDTARDVLISDALTKNKSNTYGIASTEKWSTTKSVGTDDRGNKVNLAYNSEEYRKMQQAIDAARAAGRDTVDYKAMDGNIYSYSVGRFQELQGLYAKEFSEMMSNQASLSETNWEAVDKDTKLQLDKVRGKAIEFRNELKDNLTNVVVEAANADAAVGKQQITVNTVNNGNLVFNDDSAISKIGDQAKLQITANKEKLSKEKAKEDKK